MGVNFSIHTHAERWHIKTVSIKISVTSKIVMDNFVLSHYLIIKRN